MLYTLYATFLYSQNYPKVKSLLKNRKTKNSRGENWLSTEENINIRSNAL